MPNICICQSNFITNNLDYNLKKIINYINNCKKKKVDMIIFPELAVTGYPPRDKIFESNYSTQVDSTLNKIKNKSNNLCIVIGSIGYGKKKNKVYNSAYTFYNKKITTSYNKILLPNYGVFDEQRYFSPGKKLKAFNFLGQKFLLTICEDLWFENMIHNNKDIIKKGLKKYTNHIVINLSASPFDYSQPQHRTNIISSISKKYKTPIIYVNSVGAQTELIFDGNSFTTNYQGKKVHELDNFKEHDIIINTKDLWLEKKEAIPTEKKIEPDVKLKKLQIENIIKALSLGIIDFFEKQNISKKCIIGLSGGLDSALCLLLLQKALGANNISAYYLPFIFSSDLSLKNAQNLCKELGVKLNIISINRIYNSVIRSIEKNFNNTTFDITYENIQSRIRGLILMSYSNKNKEILINTSNKSELATGYGTLYGDMTGALSIIGDLYKIQVYELTQYIYENENISSLKEIIDMEPSAELNENQKDSDTLPNYEILDQILFSYINQKKTVKDIITQTKDKKLINDIIKKVSQNEFKRHQFCPILRISNISLGREWRYNIVGY